MAGPTNIYVLAGVNGAGKSSVGGAAFREFGANYFNPDEFARGLLGTNPALTQTEANAVAWLHGRNLLERAIAQRFEFAMETTLGGSTIPRLLAHAATERIAVRVWYAGLSSAELHIARVRARVRLGGHHIPEADICRRFEHSRLNLIAMLPKLAALRVFDNSADADPASGKSPKLVLVLGMERGKIVAPKDLRQTPEWAKPIAAAAMQH